MQLLSLTYLGSPSCYMYYFIGTDFEDKLINEARPWFNSSIGNICYYYNVIRQWAHVIMIWCKNDLGFTYFRYNFFALRFHQFLWSKFITFLVNSCYLTIFWEKTYGGNDKSCTVIMVPVKGAILTLIVTGGASKAPPVTFVL